MIPSLASALLLALSPVLAAPPETVGKRPYELDWAGRTEEPHAPLAGFEDGAAWRIAAQDAEARFEVTREQQIWGRHVGKLVYRGTGPRPAIRIEPPPRSPSRAPSMR